MFENLSSQQKIMFILISIVALICLVLVLYLALSKKPCPSNKSTPPPSLVKFAISRADPPSIPWITPTYYKYSYYINDPSIEGDKSDASSAVSDSRQTNPIIQVTPLSGYKINVYRAIDNGHGVPETFSLLQVTVDDKGLFTDTNNPSPTKPPTPVSKPMFTGWESGGGGGLQCPSSSQKCTGKCNSGGGCGVNVPWQCTLGGAKGGCAKDDWELADNCSKYCFISK
jgi:hypothetical protein